LGKGNCVSIW